MLCVKSTMTKQLKLCKELIVKFDVTGNIGGHSVLLDVNFFEDATYKASLLLLKDVY